MACGSCVLVFANSIWNLENFRLNLIKFLTQKGYTLKLAAPINTQKDKEIQARLETLGFSVYPISLSRTGTNPLYELKTLKEIVGLVEKEGIDIILPFTIKPNLYSSLVAMFIKIKSANRRSIKVICNITGLGSAFLGGGALSVIIKLLYKVALKYCSGIFFQNSDDRNLLSSLNLLPKTLLETNRVQVLPGSGVDLETFKPQEENTQKGISFLCIARLLKDKGIVEFYEAAKAFKEEHLGEDLHFYLLGGLDSNPSNPRAISKEMLHEWEKSGVIEYLGECKDVRPFIAKSSCVVLASYYREGTPRSLLEACAMGKPIIAADSVGTREAVKELDNKSNGYICKAKDYLDLKRCFEEFYHLSPQERETMGENSRKVAEKFFSENIVLEAYLKMLQDLRA